MNKDSFLSRLKYLLQELPEEERIDALRYYEEYFIDASPEREEEIVKELGSPEEVAAIIKENLKGNPQLHGEYTETGYEDFRFSQYHYPSKREENKEEAPYRRPQSKKSSNWVLWIILALITCPVWLTAAGAVVLVIFSGIMVVASCFLAAVFVAIAFFIAGIAIFIFGLTKMFLVPSVTLFLCGVGLMFFAASIVIGYLTYKLITNVLPVCIRGFVAVCRWPFKIWGSRVGVR